MGVRALEIGACCHASSFLYRYDSSFVDHVQVAYPFVRDMFLADDNKPLPNIAPDANTPPVVMMPGMGMSAPIAPMGGMAPGFPMMGGGLPMGPMGPMGPLPPPPVAPQIPMQLHPPHGELRMMPRAGSYGQLCIFCVCLMHVDILWIDDDCRRWIEGSCTLLQLVSPNLLWPSAVCA